MQEHWKWKIRKNKNWKLKIFLPSCSITWYAWALSNIPQGMVKEVILNFGKRFFKDKKCFLLAKAKRWIIFSQSVAASSVCVYLRLFVCSVYLLISIYGEMFLLAFVLYRTVDKVRVHSEEVALPLNLTKSGTLGSTKFENMFRKNTPAAAACPRPCVLHTYYCC